jgi:hypothetical protein
MFFIVFWPDGTQHEKIFKYCEAVENFFMFRFIVLNIEHGESSTQQIAAYVLVPEHD